MNIMIFTSNRW